MTLTLTTRLTLIGLITIVIVLAGFSISLYLVASDYLHRRTEERLAAAISVLVAAAEVKPDGVEWEPEERRLLVGLGAEGDGIVWSVTDADGTIIDRVVPSAATDFLTDTVVHLRETQGISKKVRWQEGRWLVRQERVYPANPALPFAPDVESGHKHPALIVTAGISLEPVRTTLRELVLVLVIVSLTVWAVVAFTGRKVCRWALRPLIRMADEARGMSAADLGVRLPSAQAKDELADLADAFNALLGRVQDVYERQQSFTAEASHQLRTPLTALLGQVEVALRRERDKTEYQRVLGSVHRQADRLRKVVESLMFLARTDADTVLPVREQLDLGAWLLEHIRTEWADHPRFADIQVETSAVSVMILPVLFGELVNVFLDNACKYSPSGTSITVRVKSVTDVVELSVIDNGIGLAEEDAGRIFDPFVRSIEAHRLGVEGIGLGLSVARRIAVAHRGKISVKSLTGKGCCFTFQMSRSQNTIHPF